MVDAQPRAAFLGAVVRVNRVLTDFGYARNAASGRRKLFNAWQSVAALWCKRN